MERLILGPMATLCHEAFRRTVENFGGCDEYFTEMINAPALKNGGQWEKFYLMNDCAPEKIVWQLTGNSIEAISWAAENICAEKGGIGVDLNMGCCAPQIIRGGCGILWMNDEKSKETALLVKNAKSALLNAEKIWNEKNGDCAEEKKHFRLSAKIRLGYDDFTMEKLLNFCKMLEDEGVEMITLHPRTKSEKYRNPVHLDAAAEVCLKISVPMIFNGDIKDKASFLRAKKAVPDAEGFMVSRAAAQKPWIFKELRLRDGESFTVDLLKAGLDFIEDVKIYQPKEFWKTRLQRFFSYYAQNFSFAHFAQTQLLNAANSSNPIEETKSALEDYFVRSSGERFKVVK